MKNINQRYHGIWNTFSLPKLLSTLYELGSIKCYMPLMLALLICVYGLIQNIAWANDAEGGFVWKIQKSGQPDSYLIGTVHLGKKGAVLPESYVRILNKQTVLLVESNEDDWNGVNGIRLNQQMDGLIIAPVQLKNSVGSERIKRVNALLLRNGSDLQLDSNAYMAPWMVWMALATDYNMPGYSMDTGIDVLLMHAAKKRQRTIVALETIEPLHVFKRIPNARLLRAIDADLHNVQAMQQEQIQMLQYYHSGNSKALVAKTFDADDAVKQYPKQDRQFWKQWMYGDLLQQRNVAWMPKLVGQIKQGPTVIAVGAAHLYGGSGLIVLLRERGYQVTPYRI